MAAGKSKGLIAIVHIIVALLNVVGYLALLNFDLFLPIKELRNYKNVSQLSEFLEGTKNIKGEDLKNIKERTYIIVFDISRSLIYDEEEIPQWAEYTAMQLNKFIRQQPFRNRLSEITLYESTVEDYKVKNARIICKYKLFSLLLNIEDATGKTNFSLWELGNEYNHIYPRNGFSIKADEDNIANAIIEIYKKDDCFSISSNFTDFFNFLLDKFQKMEETKLSGDTKLPLFSLVLISDLKHDIVDITREKIETKFKNQYKMYSQKMVDEKLEDVCKNDLSTLKETLNKLYLKDVFFQIIVFPSIQVHQETMNTLNVSNGFGWNKFKVSIYDELKKVGFGKMRMREISLDESDFKLIAPPSKSTKYIDFFYTEEKKEENFSYTIVFNRDGDYIMGLNKELDRDVSYLEKENVDFFYQIQNGKGVDINEKGCFNRLIPGVLTSNIKIRSGEQLKLYFSGRPFSGTSNYIFPGFELYMPEKERHTVVIPMRFKKKMEIGLVFLWIIISALCIIVSFCLLYICVIKPILRTFTDPFFNLLNKIRCLIKKIFKDIQ